MNHIYNIYYLEFYGEGKGYWQKLCEVMTFSEANAIAEATMIYGPPKRGKYKAEQIR
jgi:hypothetical protein